jgi:hypothetical protein
MSQLIKGHISNSPNPNYPHRIMLRSLTLAVISILFILPQHAHPFVIMSGHGLHSSVRKYDSRLFDVEEEPERRRDTIASASGSPMFGVDEYFIAFPSRNYEAAEIVQLCMDALLHNGEPYANAGLEVCWNFSSDRCRAAQGSSLEKFIQFANNPVFGSMVDAQTWRITSTGPLIPGTQTRGAMQTVLAEVVPAQGRTREFLWTLQRERRPPRQDCWLVHECLFKDAAYEQTL